MRNNDRFHSSSSWLLIRLSVLFLYSICSSHTLLASPFEDLEEQEQHEQEQAQFEPYDIEQIRGEILSKVAYLQRQNFAKTQLARELFHYNTRQHFEVLQKKKAGSLHHTIRDLETLLNPIHSSNFFLVTANELQPTLFLPVLFSHIEGRYYDLLHQGAEIKSIDGLRPEQLLLEQYPTLVNCTKISPNNPLKSLLYRRQIDQILSRQYICLSFTSNRSSNAVQVVYKDGSQREIQGFTSGSFYSNIIVTKLPESVCSDTWLDHFTNVVNENCSELIKEKKRRCLVDETLVPWRSPSFVEWMLGSPQYAKRINSSVVGTSDLKIGYISLDHSSRIDSEILYRALIDLEKGSDCLILDLRKHSSRTAIHQRYLVEKDQPLYSKLSSWLCGSDAQDKVFTSISLNRYTNRQLCIMYHRANYLLIRSLFDQSIDQKKTAKRCSDYHNANQAYIEGEKTFSIPLWPLTAEKFESEQIYSHPIFLLVDETTSDLNEALAATLVADGAKVIGRPSAGMPFIPIKNLFNLSNDASSVLVGGSPCVTFYQDGYGSSKPLDFVGLSPDIKIEKTLEDEFSECILIEKSVPEILKILKN